MSIITPSYEQESIVRDDKFDIDQLHHYTLCLQLSDHDFEFCIIDEHHNKCLMVEKFNFISCYNTEQVTQSLEYIYDDHSLLQAGFWKKIKLSIKNSKFSLVPKSLFEKDHLEKYLEINCSYDKKVDVLQYKKLNSIDAINIFSINEKMVNWFKQRYQNKDISIMHETSPFIEGVFSLSELSEDRQVFIYADVDHIQLVVTNNRALEYSNIFYYSTPEDLSYYVLYVFNELKINPETIETFIWGEIDSTSAHYHKLFTYIRNIQLGDRPESLLFSYHFDDIEEQKFFSLYNMHLCD